MFGTSQIPSESKTDRAPRKRAEKRLDTRFCGVSLELYFKFLSQTIRDSFFLFFSFFLLRPWRFSGTYTVDYYHHGQMWKRGQTTALTFEATRRVLTL